MLASTGGKRHEYKKQADELDAEIDRLDAEETAPMPVFGKQSAQGASLTAPKMTAPSEAQQARSAVNGTKQTLSPAHKFSTQTREEMTPTQQQTETDGPGIRRNMQVSKYPLTA